MKPPAWFNRDYAGYTGWSDAVEQCRVLLIDRARTEGQATYKEIAEFVTAIPWPEGDQRGSQFGYLLAQISYEEWLQTRPLLSALAVKTTVGSPRTGFLDSVATS